MSTGASAVATSGSTGIIIGVIAGVIIALVLALVFMRHRRTKGQDEIDEIEIIVRPRTPPTSLATSRFINSYNQPGRRPEQLYALMNTERH